MQTKPNMTPVGPVRLPDQMIAQLDKVADRLGHSRSGLIRLALRDYLARQA